MALPTRLEELKTLSGEPLIPDGPEGAEFRYNIVALLETTRSKDLRLFFNPDADGVTKFSNWRQAYFAMPSFNDARQKQQLLYETYLNKTIPLESISCPHCGSTNVDIGGIYSRSLDEAGVPSAVCRNCGNKRFSGL